MGTDICVVQGRLLTVKFDRALWKSSNGSNATAKEAAFCLVAVALLKYFQARQQGQVSPESRYGNRRSSQDEAKRPELNYCT